MEKTEIVGREVLTRTSQGSGFKEVLRDLLCCPRYVGVWVAAGLVYLYCLIPVYMWLFILVMAIAEIGSILQTISTILVRVEKCLKGLGVPEENL